MALDAAESLTSCLFEMATAETNPVLQVIDINNPIEENKKYPPELLQFNHSGWRAYYHCHPASRAGNHRFQGEHGHFHIFVRIQKEPEIWSHIVALAMDNMGQPLGWFTVNHWVTGQSWSKADDLVRSLSKIPYQKQNTLLERWLLSLLHLSHEKVTTILYERDKVIEIKQNNSEGKNIKQDRELYLLTEIAMNIKELLEIKR